MSNKFKPLYTQVAEQLAAQLKTGTSPLQKPVTDDGRPAFIKPVNPFTGKGYSVLNALNLALKNLPDPRWMSLKDASFKNFQVKEGEKATLIRFPKKSDIVAVRDASGEKIKDDAGKTQTRTVEFEKPQSTNAFLFNATQMKEFPSLEEFNRNAAQAETLSPFEKAERLIAESGAVIIHGGNEAYYDKSRDAIFLPEKEQFIDAAKYYQAAIHQLAHWTGHESRLNRPMDGKFGSMEYGKEELRAAITAMVIGAETGLGNNFPHHAAYSHGWSKQLLDRPYDMAKVAGDAQKAVSLLMRSGQKRDEKKSASQSNTLSKGDAIKHNGTTYTVTAKKGSVVTIDKEDTAEKFKAKPTDSIYGKLVAARNGGPTQEQSQNEYLNEEPELALENEPTHKIGR